MFGLLFLKVGFPESNIVVVFLFAVLLVVSFTKGYLYGILSSVVCLLCYNYFFTAPYHTLEVNDPSYMITFVVMLITSLMTSALTTKEKLMTVVMVRIRRSYALSWHQPEERLRIILQNPSIY